TEALSAGPDTVLAWNAIAAQTIVGPGGANKPPMTGMVDAALMHTAIYDAVNAIEGYPFSAYAIRPQVVSPASPEAAAATAGHDVLVALYPAKQASLDQALAASLALIPDGDEE